MLRHLKWSFFIAVGFIGAMSCGPLNTACENFPCEDGFSCLLQNGEPTCVPNGNGGGGGGTGQAGDACETTADCETPLTCLPDLNGDTVCSN